MDVGDVMGATIAAIVPCRNRKGKTLRFLQQIFKQTYPDLTVIIVDADSTDGTPEAVAHYYPKAIVLQVGAEDYWSATTNAGVKFALAHQFDYILTINDDCTIAPDHVQILFDTAQQHQVHILGSRIDYLAQPGRVWAMGTSVIWGPRLLKLNAHSVSEDSLLTDFKERSPIAVDTMPGNGVLIHRSVFESVGVYDSRMLPHYHGDSEWVMRATRQGFQAFVTGRTVLYDDTPLPQKQTSSTDRFWMLDFWQTFFHPRSGWYLKPRIYLILTYCPWPLKPLTLLQGTVGVAIGWLGQRCLRWVRRRFTAQKKLSQKLTRFLEGIEPRVETTAIEQVTVVPHFDDFTLIEHHDLVGFSHGAESVGNNNQRTGPEERSHRKLNRPF